VSNWKLPLLIDSNGKPSITALFAYISFIQAVCLIIYLARDSALSGVIAGLVLFFVCLFIYRLRRLDSFEIDVDDKSIKVNGKKDEVKNDT
jgi:hypothetical protein